MKMYSRDDLMNTKNFGGEDGDDEDDDDEDDTQFPSKLVITIFQSIHFSYEHYICFLCHVKKLIQQGRALRDKENTKSGLKQKITHGIIKTKDTLKKHANKVSNWLRQRWRGLKKTASKKSTKAGKAEL